MSDYRSYPSPQQTPQRGRPSTPSKPLYAPAVQTPHASPFPQTPCKSRSSRTTSTGLPTPQITPFPKHRDGSPVKLYTPKELAEMSQQRSGAPTAARPRVASTGSPTKPRFPSTMEPPTQRRVASATDTPTRQNRFIGRTHISNATSALQSSPKIFPPRIRTRSTSPTKPPAGSSAPVDLIALRKERREPATRRTVRLLSVMNKCWGDDTEDYFRWTFKDSLLRGGCEERVPRDIWGDLRYVVGDLWPDLVTWIMHQTPTEDDNYWFDRAGGCRYEPSEYASSPQIDREQSSQERVGFCMSSDAFAVACAIIQELANGGYSFDCLLNANMNPFFTIYAFAACNVHLPHNFSRQLFWKHLDALVHIQRCPGLQSTHSNGSTTGTRRVSPKIREFSQPQDPEDIVGSLLALRNTGQLPLAEYHPPAHELFLIIDGARWTASTSSLGRFSYTAEDLSPDDVAPFALLDALTRWLPRWRSGAIFVRTNDVCVMWGVRGHARSGAWRAVRRVCAQYDVTLQRTEMIDHRLEDHVLTSGNNANRATVERPLRDPDAVKTAVKGLAAPGYDSDPAHRVMMRHLTL